MTTRRTVLNLEELGARVLPSATVAIPTAAAAARVATTTTVTTGQAWAGQGRFAITTNSATHAKTYTLTGSTEMGSAFYAISGSVTTDGNRSGHATGQVKLSSSKGTLTLSLTGPTQSANAGLPSSLTYKVVSGTGAFAHYSGQGTIRLSTTLFLGFSDRGQFTLNATAPTALKPPTTPPPVNSGKITGPSWAGHGRFTITTHSGTTAKTYTFQGSADFGRSGYFSISGSITTVGSRSGHVTGHIVMRSSKGTLTLNLIGPTQTANSRLPSSLTYTVASGTGFFARYAGRGTVQLSTGLFSGYTTKGHFDIAVRPTSV